MSTVVRLRPEIPQDGVPTLVLIDLQREYMAAPRAMTLPDADGALVRCREALGFARSAGLPVAHVRTILSAPYFNSRTPFAQWIEGFEPLSSEMTFERKRPSCYDSSLFADVMGSSGGHIVMAGFAGQTSCLSTAIDAFHRDHRVTFLTDASASHPVGRDSATAVHRSVSGLISLYGRVSDTCSWIEGHATSVARGREARGFA